MQVVFILQFILVTIHLFFWFAAVRAFDIRNRPARWLTFAFSLLVSISFPASFFLLRWQENGLTSTIYVIFAAVLGWVIHCAILSVLGAFVWIAFRVMKKPVSSKYVAVGCFVLSLAASVLGMVNARIPTVHRITVGVDYVPESWRGKTLVQLSDVHLGHVQGPGFLDRLVEKVNSLEPDVICLTGDLFDGMSRNTDRFVDGLNRLSAKQGVFFITGNHEHYIGVDRALSVIRRTRIRILDNEAVDIGGLELIGVGYPGIRGAADIRGWRVSEENQSVSPLRALAFHTPTNWCRLSVPAGTPGRTGNRILLLNWRRRWASIFSFRAIPTMGRFFLSTC